MIVALGAAVLIAVVLSGSLGCGVTDQFYALVEGGK